MGQGNVPCSLKCGFEKAKTAEIPIVVATQCRDGETKMFLYESGQNALNQGAIEAFDMSLEVCVVKLMWILGQGVQYKNVPKLMQEPLVGEIKSAYKKT